MLVLSHGQQCVLLCGHVEEDASIFVWEFYKHKFCKYDVELCAWIRKLYMVLIHRNMDNHKFLALHCTFAYLYIQTD